MDDVTALGLLDEPVRRALYEYVAAQGREVGREEAAGAVGVQRTLAAFHLDKLAEAGLLAVTFRRLGGRSGPGAGRPAKLYRATAAEVWASVPPRAYAAAAHLLAAALERARADAVLTAVAREDGERVGRAAAGQALEPLLAARGYEPYRDGDCLRLGNCPFGSVAADFPPLVCGMNLALLEGVLAGMDADAQATLDPAPGRCCVAIA